MFPNFQQNGYNGVNHDYRPPFQHGSTSNFPRFQNSQSPRQAWSWNNHNDNFNRHPHPPNSNHNNTNNFRGCETQPMNGFHNNDYGYKNNHNVPWNGRNNAKNKKPRKEKVNKRDLAENNIHFCDTCDRGFKTDDDFRVHVDGHTQCSVKGCSYIAAPKLVKLHYDLQHKSGMAKKICSTDSPEEITKWIESRKKNYPTAENVARKKLIETEKKARGEVIETKYFGKFKQGNINPHENSRNGNNRQRNRKRNGKTNWEDRGKSAEQSDIKKMKADPDGNNMNESNADCPSRSNQPSTDKPAQPPSHIKVEDSGSMETNVISKPEAKDSQGKYVTMSTIRSTKRKNLPKKTDLFSPNRSSLLEKLLANEIRHERNIILQCVHHIVKRKFFGVVPKADDVTAISAICLQTSEANELSDSSDDSGVAMETESSALKTPKLQENRLTSSNEETVNNDKYAESSNCASEVTKSTNSGNPDVPNICENVDLMIASNSIEPKMELGSTRVVIENEKIFEITKF